MTMMCLRMTAMLGVLVIGMSDAGYTQSVYAISETAELQANTPQRLVTLNLRNVSVPAAIQAIARQAGVPISIGDDALDVNARVDIAVERVTLEAAVQAALQGTGLRLQTLSSGALYVNRDRQTRRTVQGTIVGRVINAKTKQPIAGVTIAIDGGASVTSNEDGTFRLPAAAGEQTVQIRFVGFVRVVRKVTVAEGESVALEVALEPSANVLDQIVVTGTVVATERKAIPTPITVLSAKDLQDRGITNLEQLFRGEIPGVVALDMGSLGMTDDALGGTAISSVFSRGASGLDGYSTTSPLKTYVDGIELSDPSFLGTIDPNSIERIEILTGPQAATIYGSGAMGGVMQIFTKKGTASSTHDVTVSLKYGVLQNSLSPALAPQHNHVVNYAGGAGPVLSYAINASYNYTGQWTPGVFSRQAGVSLGLSHIIGPVNVSGTYSTTFGKNGTARGNAREYYLHLNGEQQNRYSYKLLSGIVGTQQSQNIALNATFRVLNYSQHTVTLGRSGTVFDLIPESPLNQNASDSLYRYRNRNTSRTTGAYTIVFNPVDIGMLSAHFSTGVSGSSGANSTVSGEKGNIYQSSLMNLMGSLSPDENSAGMFGSLRVGLFGALYTTLGIRIERNSGYGDQKATNFTPSNGIAYTLEAGELSLKFMGSYGSATRAPKLEQKLGQKVIDPSYEPGEYWSILPNEFMTPEYSKGPQGGIELYYGNRGSLFINHYQQKVTDLITSLTVDTIQRLRIADGIVVNSQQRMYVNAASIRQRGWEVGGSVNLYGVRVSGTYSLSESKIISRGPHIPATELTNIAIPARSGNITVNYARGRTTMTLVTNYIGQQYASSGQEKSERANLWNARLTMYQGRARYGGISFMQAGYFKQNLTASHRVFNWLDLTTNIINLTNSYNQEAVGNAFFYPTLGRVSTFGVSLRPSRR